MFIFISTMMANVVASVGDQATGRAAFVAMGAGTCAETPAEVGDCARPGHGSFASNKYNLKTLEDCVSICLRKCERCEYVSFSVGHEDCSWFTQCPGPLQLTRGGNTYQTAAVRPHAIALARRAAQAEVAVGKLPYMQLYRALQKRDEIGAFAVLRKDPGAAKRPSATSVEARLGGRRALAKVLRQQNNTLPLHVAIRDFQASDALIIEILASDPTAANMPDDHGNLPLVLLAGRMSPPARLSSIDALLRASRPDAALRPRGDRMRYLPLHLALLSGTSSEVVLAILRAQPRAASVAGATRRDLPLHLACEYRASSNVIEALLRAHPPAAHHRMPGGDSSSEYGAGYLPLHLAAMHRADVAVVRLLLDANPNGATSLGPYHELPYHLAMEYGAPAATCRLLLDAHPDAKQRRDDGGSTPQQIAHSGRATTSSGRRAVWITRDGATVTVVRGGNGATCETGCDLRLPEGSFTKSDGVQPAVGLCLPPSIAPNATSCCEQCAATLGCKGWIEKGKKVGLGAREWTTCCLRSTWPDRWPRAHRRQCYGVLTSEPCRFGCNMMRSKPPAASWLGSDVGAKVDVHTFPWVDIQYRSKPPRRQRRATRTNAAETRPSVAICLAGNARTIIHPHVWSGIWTLRGGSREEPQDSREPPLDLFLVLGTEAERMKLGEDGHSGRTAPAMPHPRLLEHAVTAIAPTAVRFVTRRDPTSCGSASTSQFAKWARCVELVRRHELTGAEPYEFLFKGRPDIALHAVPFDLRALASQLSTSTIMTGNDILVLAHRSKWHALTALRPGRLRCDPRCSGHDAAVIRNLIGLPYNEYCLMVSTWAALEVNHMEASHPPEPEWMVYRSFDIIGGDASRPSYDLRDVSWAWQMYHRLAWKVARFQDLPHFAHLHDSAERQLDRLSTSEPQRSTMFKRQKPGRMRVEGQAMVQYAASGLFGAVVCRPAASTCGVGSSVADRAPVECIPCTSIAHAITAGNATYGDEDIGFFHRLHRALKPQGGVALPSLASIFGIAECPSYFSYSTTKVSGSTTMDAPSRWQWPSAINLLPKIMDVFYHSCGRIPNARCAAQDTRDAHILQRFLKAEALCRPPGCNRRQSGNYSCESLLAKFYPLVPAHRQASIEQTSRDTRYPRWRMHDGPLEVTN